MNWIIFIQFITSNKYGKGGAIYIGIPVKSEILIPLLNEEYQGNWVYYRI